MKSIDKIRRILLVTTLPSEVSNVRIPQEIEPHIFDFSENHLSKKDFMHWLGSFINSERIEFMVTYRCPYIITSGLIELLAESVNIHPLALPQFAGLNPWEKFMKSGMNNSEAVLHRLAYTADTGEIIMREPFSFTDISEARKTADCAAARLFDRYLNSITEYIEKSITGTRSCR